jgi:hypothetical protein
MRGKEELGERMIMEYCIDNGKYDGKNDKDDLGDEYDQDSYCSQND